MGTGLQNKGKREHGALDALAKKQEAKAAMQIQASKARQVKAQSEAKKKSEKEKTTRIIIIGTVSVVLVIGIIATVIYFKKKK